MFKKASSYNLLQVPTRKLLGIHPSVLLLGVWVNICDFLALRGVYDEDGDYSSMR
jgi:hypothetical protein